MNKGHLLIVVGSLSYSTALALIPFLVVVLATFKVVGGFEALYPKVEVLLLSYLQEAAGIQITDMIELVLRNISAGKVGTIGGVFLFLTSVRLLGEMETAVHIVWGIRNTRSFYRRFLYQWGLMLCIPFVLAIYLGVISYEALQFVNYLIPSFILNTFVVFLGFFIVHKYVPNIQVDKKIAAISAAICTVLLLVVHNAYVFLGKGFFSYNKVYGSFAAFPLLLLWIQNIWFVILGSVALCASLQKRADRAKNPSLPR